MKKKSRSTSKPKARTKSQTSTKSPIEVEAYPVPGMNDVFSIGAPAKPQYEGGPFACDLQTPIFSDNSWLPREAKLTKDRQEQPVCVLEGGGQNLLLLDYKPDHRIGDKIIVEHNGKRQHIGEIVRINKPIMSPPMARITDDTYYRNYWTVAVVQLHPLVTVCDGARLPSKTLRLPRLSERVKVKFASGVTYSGVVTTLSMIKIGKLREQSYCFADMSEIRLLGNERSLSSISMSQGFEGGIVLDEDNQPLAAGAYREGDCLYAYPLVLGVKKQLR